MRARSPAVTLVPHPASAKLDAALQGCVSQAILWEGPAFRFSDFTFANLADLLTGKGSLKAGGRWNPKGAFPALYFSLTPETALAEALAHHRSQALPDVEATPLALVGSQVKVQRVLDLTNAAVLQQLGLTTAQLTSPWRPDQNAGREALTQAVGRLARHRGLHGLLVPSAALAGSRNLVVFPDRVGPADLVVVHDEKFPQVRRRLRRK